MNAQGRDCQGRGLLAVCRLELRHDAGGKVLRSKSPEMVRQEIWGYLLTHYAVSALICTATAAGTDPDRVKFKRVQLFWRDS